MLGDGCDILGNAAYSLVLLVDAETIALDDLGKDSGWQARELLVVHEILKSTSKLGHDLELESAPLHSLVIDVTEYVFHEAVIKVEQRAGLRENSFTEMNQGDLD